MNRIFLLHDLDEDEETLRENLSKDTLIFCAKPDIKTCIGCFGCWLKTPGICILNDRAKVMPTLLASCDKFVIISRLVYGSYSPEIKATMDRSIGYLMPYFRIIHGEMHHVMRYENSLSITAHFYNTENIDSEERQIARELVQRNVLDLGAKKGEAFFHSSIPPISEVIL